MPFTERLALLQVTLPGEKFAVAEEMSITSGSQSSLACACSIRREPVVATDGGGGVALVSGVIQGPVKESSRSAVAGDSAPVAPRAVSDEPRNREDLLTATRRERSAGPA